MKKTVSGIAAVVLALSLSVSAFAAPSVTYPAEVSGATTSAGNTTRPTTNTTTTDTTPTTPMLQATPLTNPDIADSFNASVGDGVATLQATENADGTISVEAELKTSAGDVPLTISNTKTAAGLLNVVELTVPKDSNGALLLDVADVPVTDKAQITFNANNAKAAKEMPITTNVSMVDLIKNTLANSSDAVKDALGASGMSDADLEEATVSITVDSNGDSYITTDNGFAAKINNETVAEQEITAVGYTEKDFPLTLDFAVPGAKEGMAYQVQHKMNGVWQMEKTLVTENKVTATDVASLSPFRVTLTTLEPIGAVVEAAPVTSEATSEAASSEASAEAAPAEETKSSFPIVPVVGGVGIVAVIAAVVGVRKSKKKDEIFEEK